ncbi:MAG: hypothetical protein JNL21_03025 [Myxococcales bacterium]|nr:hypothetical protein [Myxococcales bacterium]
MAEDKKPTDKAKESLERGFSELFRAAGSVAEAVKRETKKSGGLTKAVDDAGREIVRAASNVATFVGSELTTWGKKAQEAVDPDARAHAQHTEEPMETANKKPQSAVTGEEDWPKTREEYEKKYDSEGDEWPRSREEYIRRFGRPPRPKSDDPGFRIATGK